MAKAKQGTQNWYGSISNAVSRFTHRCKIPDKSQICVQPLGTCSLDSRNKAMNCKLAHNYRTISRAPFHISKPSVAHVSMAMTYNRWLSKLLAVNVQSVVSCKGL